MTKFISISIIVFICIVGFGCGSKTGEQDSAVTEKKNNAIKKSEKKMEKPISKAEQVKILVAKCKTLVKEKKLTEAIEVIDRIINLNGENRSILGYKYDLLMQLNRYEDALKIALRRDEVAKRKSPWNCVSIAEAYLKLDQKEKAVDYLVIAVRDRQFNNLKHLSGEQYAPLKDIPRFQALIAEIKDLIGIGKVAKDFTVSLVNGSEFKLSAQKGHVVLVDFWATWCPPCREELPNIKKLYNMYKDKGFKIIGISLDKDQQKHLDFIKEKGMGWDLSYSGKGWFDDTVKLYNVSSIPSIWLVDRQGVLRFFDIHGDELTKRVQELLGVTEKTAK